MMLMMMLMLMMMMMKKKRWSSKQDMQDGQKEERDRFFSPLDHHKWRWMKEVHRH